MWILASSILAIGPFTSFVEAEEYRVGKNYNKIPLHGYRILEVTAPFIEGKDVKRKPIGAKAIQARIEEIFTK